MEDPEAGFGARHDKGAERFGSAFEPVSGEAGSGSREGSAAKAARDARQPALARPSANPPRRRKHRRGRRKVFARETGSPNTEPARETAAEPLAARSIPRTAPLPSDVLSHDGPRAPVRNSPDDRPLFAALDLGTNNCRLLVATPTGPGNFRIVDAFSRIVRLGEGVSATGRLGEAAMDRAVEALRICSVKLQNRQLRRTRLIATEACRTAANGAEFIERVHRHTGLKLEIIDRRTEARLAVAGCGQLIEPGTSGVVLFDIGGGSSEIALVDLSRQRTPKLANHIVSWTSLPVGVVSLAERHGGREVTPEMFDAMVDDVSAMIERFDGRDRLAHLAADKGFYLLGTSGTVTTLAGVHLGLDRYDRRRVDGLWLSGPEVGMIVGRLRGWSFAERVANPCIGPDRADLVLAGCAILEAIRRFWPAERLRVADRGLREGILNELMSDEGVWRRRGRHEARP